MTGPEAQKLLQETARQLGEHFDSVQIMGAWDEGGFSYCSKAGVGSWYARQGMAHEFINADIAHEQAYQISQRLNPPEEGPPE